MSHVNAKHEDKFRQGLESLNIAQVLEHCGIYIKDAGEDWFNWFSKFNQFKKHPHLAGASVEVEEDSSPDTLDADSSTLQPNPHYHDRQTFEHPPTNYGTRFRPFLFLKLYNH
jgi:hypothetical protein